MATVLLTAINATQVKGISNSVSSSNLLNEVKPQNGKLQFVNDTPYTALVLLYKPGMQQPNRYANIPPCHVRRLLDTYNNSWGVSVNNAEAKKITSVADISERSIFNNDKNAFVIKISILNQNPSSKRTCRYQIQSQNIGIGDDKATGLKYAKAALADVNFAKLLQYADDSNFEKSAKATAGAVSNMNGIIAVIENILGLGDSRNQYIRNLYDLLADNDLREALENKNLQKLQTKLSWVSKEQLELASFFYKKYIDVKQVFELTLKNAKKAAPVATSLY
ncbi:hypothetical protein H1Q63_03480 [Desmonostoc muscorum CCALA 125]|nr:hypothetical protein [Desmonostoc muscorum CCALA 125]